MTIAYSTSNDVLSGQQLIGKSIGSPYTSNDVYIDLTDIQSIEISRSKVRTMPERDETILDKQKILADASVPGSSGSSEVAVQVLVKDFLPDVTDQWKSYYRIREILKDISETDEDGFLAKVKAGIEVILKGNNDKPYESNDIFSGMGREIIGKLKAAGLNTREQATVLAVSFLGASYNYRRNSEDEISKALAQMGLYLKSRQQSWQDVLNSTEKMNQKNLDRWLQKSQAHDLLNP